MTVTANLADWLRSHGVKRGDLVGIALRDNSEVGVAVPGAVITARSDTVAKADQEIRPRWAAWPDGAYDRLIADGVRLATAWDVAAVHRLRFGGWRADPGYVWAIERGLDPAKVGNAGTLFSDEEAGHLDPSARDDPAQWAAYALDIAINQNKSLSGDGKHASTARSESTVELLCAELAADGLPLNRQAITELLEEIIGPRDEAMTSRAERDARVLAHAPPGVTADLRSPQQVLKLLGAVGIDVPDTRAHRLKSFDHPLVNALLEWRRAERIATTYGYTWLDDHLGADDRLRGTWTGCDGAAGRMTASEGLHNMPAILRKAVLAEEGHVFVRADLGQIEPRVLAAVSGDRALAAATEADDMYLPVAQTFGVSRDAAKVAVLGAMYGQTTGTGAQALRRLKRAYPVAMDYLDAADERARTGHDLRTHGGRLVRMRSGGTPPQVAARGRYGRNAMIQGAAAEFFKMWAVTVRARVPAARIVLCLHDELLIHTPEHNDEAVSTAVRDCLDEVSARWAAGSGVRFNADISIVRSWADAKSLGFAADAAEDGDDDSGRRARAVVGAPRRDVHEARFNEFLSFVQAGEFGGWARVEPLVV
jgi:DNA polymerase-1